MKMARKANLKSIDNNRPFKTTKEYLEFLCKNGVLIRNLPRQNYFKGTLKIDKNDIVSGLDWSDIVVDKAIVDSDMVKNYSALPKTRNGVMTSLIPQTFEQYMEYNYFGSKNDDGYFNVDIFRIHQQQFDYSKVKANIALCYASKINLSKLPYANKIYGLSSDNLIIDCQNAYNVAKEKGVSDSVIKQLKPRNKFLQKMMSIFAWSKN